MLSLELALLIASSTLREGKQRGFAPLCVVVLDRGGHVLTLLRDERASIGRPDVALAKASSCLNMGFGSRELARRAEAMPQFFTALTAVFPRGGMVTVAGGVLLRSAEGELLGCVGVTGDTSDNDEICALAGITAAGLHADTGAAGRQ